MNVTRHGNASAALVAVLALAAVPHPVRAQLLTLRDAVDATLATHPAVLAARARVDGAQASRAAARAAYLPSVLGATGVTQYAEPMVVAPLHGFDPTHPPDFDETLIQSQLSLDFTVFDGGARGSNLRSADAAEAGAGLREDATEQELVQATVAAYTAVLSTQALADAAQAQVDALSSEADRARQRLQEGTAAQVEVLRADAALLDAQAQASSVVARLALARRDLERLMGADPQSLDGRELAGLEPRPAAAADDAAPPDPRVRAAQRAVDAARARVGHERAGRLPTVKASAGLLNFGSSMGNYVTEWQAGVRLSWPLFTGGARTAVIHRAEADLRVAEEELRNTELAVARELDQARTAWTEASGRARALEGSVAQWEEVTRIEVLSLEAGAGVQQDYLRAEAALFQARAGYARARYDEILALVGQARAQGRLDRDWMDAALEIRR